MGIVKVRPNPATAARTGLANLTQVIVSIAATRFSGLGRREVEKSLRGCVRAPGRSPGRWGAGPDRTYVVSTARGAKVIDECIGQPSECIPAVEEPGTDSAFGAARSTTALTDGGRDRALLGSPMTLGVCWPRSNDSSRSASRSLNGPHETPGTRHRGSETDDGYPDSSCTSWRRRSRTGFAGVRQAVILGGLGRERRRSEHSAHADARMSAS